MNRNPSHQPTEQSFYDRNRSTLDGLIDAFREIGFRKDKQEFSLWLRFLYTLADRARKEIEFSEFGSANLES